MVESGKGADEADAAILARVLRAISFSRRPGYHFSGTFLDLRPERIPAGVRCVLDVGPHCDDREGHADLIPFCVFADVAMGSAVRAALDLRGRQATMSISLSFTGRPLAGPLAAITSLSSQSEHLASQQALVTMKLTGSAGDVALGSGYFVLLDPTALYPDFEARETAEELSYAQLDAVEKDLFDRARLALAERKQGGFSEKFWRLETCNSEDGAVSRLANGLHIANRAKNVQGGVQLGIAMKTAVAALGPDWTVMALQAAFVRPGRGKEFTVRSSHVHRGSTFAVLETRIVNDEGKLVLQMTSTHSRRSP